ncbi:hypothetical protein THER5_1909 [Bifidobacterium thermacidophilum subsp. thermacidophilum]|uniref:Uncharacterized protein n=1 Tax=Bifidobacterium thermacidophilum subsp. thermacidophilum TaxID=79262 RepID=A0A087E2Q6_9BIFI|nr:hypothetical protein THER5_1909 [Bifidobacterium thermacidophilum subsp. thermacidophilum]
MRANPHTATLEPLLRTDIDGQKRHRVSQSSHTAPGLMLRSRHQCPGAPPCEPILTQRPPIRAYYHLARN